MKKEIYLLAGEPSGDLYGTQLAKELGDYSLRGVAGPLMRKEGVTPHLEMEQFAVMGFTDVAKRLPDLIGKFYTIRNSILESNPAAVVFIDYPGLNLRLARSLRKKGYKGKLIHYICPSVWAWGKKRIPQMSENLDLLLTIFPFEQKYFSETSLSVKYTGHPLTTLINQERKELNLPDNLVSLFPGSRSKEIELNLPMQLEAIKLYAKAHPETEYAICYTNEKIRQQIERLCLPMKEKIHLVSSENRYALMRASRAALAKSGTITLELALQKCPTVVSYRVTSLNRFIAKYIVKLNLPHYCIVNILGSRRVFPEFIEVPPTAEALASHLMKLTSEGEERTLCVRGCQEVKTLLSSGQEPSQVAAKQITDLC